MKKNGIKESEDGREKECKRVRKYSTNGLVPKISSRLHVLTSGKMVSGSTGDMPCVFKRITD